MKNFLQHSTLVLLGVALCATLIMAGPNPPSGINYTCDNNATAGGSCGGGGVTFTGSDYPHNLQLTLTSLDGNGVLDDTKITAPGGQVTYTETLFRGNYQVDFSYKIKGQTITETFILAIE